MISHTYLALLANTSFLLTLAVIYDLIPLSKESHSWLRQALTGFLIGLIALAVMLTPWQFSDGVSFDTRSILLSLTGFFFGPWATLVTVLLSGGLRLFQGGAGSFTGLLVILVSAGLGLGWRWLRRSQVTEPNWREFYFFGLLVHLAMLASMLTLPSGLGQQVLMKISLPVLLIYPVGTLLLGLLLTRQRQRDRLGQALRESEERLDFVLAGSQLGSWDWDLVTGRVQRNARWAEMLGYTLAEIELNVQQWTDLHHPEDRAAAWQSIQEHLAGLTPMHRIEYRMRAKDGRYRWILDQARVVQRDPSGKPLRMSGTHTDITERKLAEDNLRQRTHEAEMLSQAAAALTASLDLTQVLERLFSQLEEVVPYDSVTVFLIEDEALVAVAGHGLPHPEAVLGRRFQKSNALFEAMSELRTPLILADAQLDPRFEKWGGADYVHGWMGIPLIVQGELVGRLTMDSRQVNAYTESQAGLALAFANQAALAIHHARLYAQAQGEIAERRLVEQALRKSEALLAEAQRVGQLGHAEWLAETDELVCSAELLRIFGLPLEPLTISRSVLSAYLHPDDHLRLTELDRQAFATLQANLDYEYRILLSGNQVAWIHQQAQISYTEAGAPVRMLLVFQEITARRQVDAALRQRSEELNMLNMLGRELTASFSSESVTAVALNGMMQALQPDLAYLFLRSGQELILKETLARQGGGGHGLPNHLVGECMCGLAASENRAFYSRDIFTDWRCTWDECKKAGLKSFAAVPLRNRSEVFGVIGLAMNTERDFEQQAEFIETLASQISAALENARLFVAVRGQAAELEARVADRTQELREAQEKLIRHEKLAVLGQLAGSVGHELRNPLGVINNAIYFLRLTQPEAPEIVREYLGIIANETRNADKIISDLLDFSRSKVVEAEAISVAGLVQKTLERFPLPENIHARLELPADLPPVNLDVRQMTQVLGNLVVNACQAMPAGGDLVIGAQPSRPEAQAFVALTVQDTGAGIPPENLKKIFEPLFTTKPKGIGLGLAVSKKLVEANGGQIEVESEVGLGTVFTLSLPVVQ